MRTLILAASILAVLPAHAESPQELISTYAAAAAAAQPGFAPSPQRGRELFMRRWNVTERMPSCAACHTERPAAAGSHVITSKAIKPLAPAANAERFTSTSKVEKWFRRNCTEVVGRECSAAEKADFLRFVMQEG